MRVASSGSDQRLRHVLDTVPQLLRADRPISAALPRITELARALFAVRYAGVSLLEEDGSLGPMSFAGIPRQTPEPSGPSAVERGLFSQLVRSEDILRVDDLHNHPAFTAIPAPITSLIGMHLRYGNRTLGLLYVSDRVDGAPFTEDDEALATSLSSALGAALGNANLLRDVLRDRRWMRASNAMAGELFSIDADEPLQVISDRARELAEADMVAMLLLEDDQMHIRYARGLGSESRLVGRSYSTSEPWTARVGSGRPEIIADLGETEGGMRLERVGGVAVGPGMLLPLHGTTRVLGALFLCRHEGAPRFTKADLETAGTFADHAAVALELASARKVAEKLRLLEDRNRIARDLHDHVIQRLYATGMSLQQVLPAVDERARARIEVGVTTLDDTIRQIRNTILTLHSPEEAGSTLGTQIHTIAREATPLLGFAPLVALDTPAAEVAGPLADDLAACIREGLSNIVRHARAEAVEIRATIEDGALLLDLQDDGIGIRSTRRSGLRNLAERAEQHSGTLQISSPAEGGTLLCWRIPLAPSS